MFCIKDKFPARLARQLSVYAHSCIKQERFDGGYDMIEFWRDSDPLLARAIDTATLMFRRELRGHTFQQGWFFIHDTQCPGVDLHADPGALNVNLWLTPDEAIADDTKNGLIVYDVMAPSEWTWDEYNADPDKIASFIDSHNGRARHVPYKYRRATLFDSRLFHKTNGVHTRPGTHNKRINCTLLFQASSDSQAMQ